MNTLVKSAIFSTFLSVSAFAAEGWMTDLEAAKKKATIEKKDLLVDFTGSDWCHWCVQLEKEVFSKPEFNGSANFILVEIDFPRDKSKLSDALIKQNNSLAKKYGVQGFPTILLMDSKGRPFAKTGYEPGGARAYNKHLKELSLLKSKRDKAFTSAVALADPKEKSAALLTVLESLEGVSASAYPKVLKMILAGDPSNTVASRHLLTIELANVESVAQIKPAFAKIDEFAKKHNLKGIELQELLTKKLDILFEQKEAEGIPAIVDRIIAIDAESKLGKSLASFKAKHLANAIKEILAEKKAEAEAAEQMKKPAK